MSLHTVIQFSKISDLEDFLAVIQTETYEADRARLTLAGTFSEADIELAKAAYNAVIVVNPSRSDH